MIYCTLQKYRQGSHNNLKMKLKPSLPPKKTKDYSYDFSKKHLAKNQPKLNNQIHVSSQ